MTTISGQLRHSLNVAPGLVGALAAFRAVDCASPLVAATSITAAIVSAILVIVISFLIVFRLKAEAT
jgi:hypothetical protein